MSAETRGTLFGEFLRRYRTAAGLTQEELAGQAGLSVRAITDLERSVRRFPYPATIARLCDALQLDNQERAAFSRAGRRRLPAEANKLPPNPSHHLPSPLSSFVGRAKELVTIHDRITTVRLITLIGAGGVGKTRLALQVAAGISRLFPDGVFFIDLAQVRDPSYVPICIARAVGVPDSGVSSLQESLAAALRDKDALLILDNFEHLLDAGPNVAALLRSCPRLHILATSRVALRISGEHEIHVPPLQVPSRSRGTAVSSVLESEAGSLFLERARAVRPDMEVTEEVASALVDLCYWLDGLPLAIELAAARVRACPPEQLVTKMDRRLSLLIGGARDLPARQRTLEATIAWSYGLLSADEQVLFRRLSVFSGGFGAGTAHAVCGTSHTSQRATEEGIEALLANSLLTTAQSTGEPRFAMLETIREYAHDQLVAHGEEPSLCRKHACHFRALLQQGEQLYASRDAPDEWMDRLHREHDNLGVALDWAIQARDVEIALDLGAGLWASWASRGFYVEGRTWLARVEDLVGASARDLRMGRILVGAGLLAHLQSDLDAALASYTRGLDIARAVGDTVTIARCLNNLMVLATERADYSVARALAVQGLEGARRAGERGREVMLLNSLGTTAYAVGDLTEARDCARTALSTARAIDVRTHAARALGLLGLIAFADGDHDAAESFFNRSLLEWRKRGARYMIARSAAELGRIAGARGQHTAAHSLLADSTRELRLIGDTMSVIRCLEYSGELAARMGNVERALMLIAAANAAREVRGTPIWPVERQLLEASIEYSYAALGARGAAAWACGQSMSLAEAVSLAESMDVETRR